MKIKSSISMAIPAVAGIAMLVIAGCNDGKHWSVEGTVEGGAGKMMMLEASTNGAWSVVDSVKIGDDGRFVIKQAPAGYPDIYRLSLDGRSLYFPVDSTETVIVAASAEAFDTGYRLSGSTSAELMQRVNDCVDEALASTGAAKLSADSVMKRRIAEMLQPDWSSIVAYYAINKTIGTAPLFDPSRSFDRKIINAVANSFVVNRPNDPRTELLKNMSLSHHRAYASTTTNTMYAQEVPFVEIILKDVDGRDRSLTDEWKSHNMIVLNFTAYGAEESPAFNAALSTVYEKYRDRGLEIYQVACDDDEYAWRQAAKNIPWIAVFNSPKDGAKYLLPYNVTSLPTTYVIDRTGDNMERVDDVTQLESVVKKHI